MPVSSSNPQQQMLQQQLLLQMQQGAPGFPKDQVLQQQQGVPVNSECKPPIKSPNPQVFTLRNDNKLNFCSSRIH